MPSSESGLRLYQMLRSSETKPLASIPEKPPSMQSDQESSHVAQASPNESISPYLSTGSPINNTSTATRDIITAIWTRITKLEIPDANSCASNLVIARTSSDLEEANFHLMKKETSWLTAYQMK